MEATAARMASDFAMQDAENTPANLNAHIETQLAQKLRSPKVYADAFVATKPASSPLRSSLEPRVAPAQRLKAASPLSSPEVEPLAADPAPPVPRAAARSVPSLQDAYKARMKAREKALGHNPHTRGRNPVRTAAPLSRSSTTGVLRSSGSYLRTTSASRNGMRAKFVRKPANKPSPTTSRQRSRGRYSMGGPRLTVPASPALRSTRRSRGKSMSHAEREMLEVERLKREQQLKYKRNMDAWRRTRDGNFDFPKGNVSSKRLTMPKSPKSILEKRRGTRRYSVAGASKTPSKMTPTHPAKAAPPRRRSMAPGGMTIAQSPTFRTASRAMQKQRERSFAQRCSSNSSSSSSSNCANKWKSSRNSAATTAAPSPPLAEKLRKMQQTPQRFRTKSRRELRKGPASRPASLVPQGATTIAESPQFHTRSRPLSADAALTSEDRELLMMEQHQFKARPVNDRIFRSAGHIGVPVVPPAKLTTPMDVTFATDRRVGRVPLPPSTEELEEREAEHQFRAAPVPDYSELAHLLGGAHCEVKKPTLPQSPRLHTRDRAVHHGPLPSPAQDAYVVEHESAVEAAKMKRSAAGGAPEVAGGDFRRRSLTNPRDFRLSTELRGEAKKAQMQARLREEQAAERASRNVKARPMPDMRRVFVPVPSEKRLTEPKAFRLRSEELHAASVRNFEERRKAEQAAAREAARVKARPLPATTAAPDFVPEPPRREPVVPGDLRLASDERAIKRAEFDAYNEERVERLEEQKARSAMEAEARAQKELRRLRRTSVAEGGLAFKARKVYDPQPMVPAPATKKLTNPRSPKFRRLKHGTARRVARRDA